MYKFRPVSDRIARMRDRIRVKQLAGAPAPEIDFMKSENSRESSLVLDSRRLFS